MKIETIVSDIIENLWKNVHAKRKRGEKPAKPGDEDYPDEKAWKDAKNENSPLAKKHGKFGQTGVPFPTEEPNEFAYLDFKKWAYKNRGYIKDKLKKYHDTKIFQGVIDCWKKWDMKANKGAFSNIKGNKFGRKLTLMMHKDNLIFDKSSNKITKLKEGNFKLAHSKIEKWMPRQDQRQFYKLIDKKDVKGLVNLIDMAADEQVLGKFIKGNEVEKLAKHIIMNEGIKEAKLPKRFTVKTKQTIDGTVYSPGNYALKKKRAGGGIYLNMDKGEMLGVDVRNIPTLEEADKLSGQGMWKDTKMFPITSKIKLKDLRNGAMIHFTGPSSGAKGETWKKQGNTMICLYGDGVKGKKLSVSDMQNKLKSYGRIQLNASKELTEEEKIDWERAYKSLFYRDALFGLSKKEKKLLLKIGQKLEKEKSKLKESTSKWKETLKKLASKDVLNKLSKSDKEKLFRIAQMLKKEEHPHDLPPDDKALNEKAPPGMEDVVLKLKKRKDVKNPYAVAWAMYNKKKGK